MNRGILYSNGVVSSLSQNLLSKEFLNRLAECNSVDDMKKLLEETSLSFSEDFENINEKMLVETNKLIDFV